jgi:hypothetical protein
MALIAEEPPSPLAAGLIGDPVVHAPLGLGVEVPVVDRAANHQEQSRRGVDDPTVVLPARLQHGDRHGRVLGQPAGDGAAARAAANDDEV